MFLQNAHLYHFTLASLTALLSQADFELVKGDEYIHALFKKGNLHQKPRNQYYWILLYLQCVEILRSLKLIQLESKLRTLAKKFICKRS